MRFSLDVDPILSLVIILRFTLIEFLASKKMEKIEVG